MLQISSACSPDRSSRQNLDLFLDPCVSIMLPYKKPASAQIAVSGDYTFPPFILWPRRFPLPDFEAWRRKNPTSQVRNIVAALLFEAGASMSEIAIFLGLSESRSRTLIRTTQKTLFGQSSRMSMKVLNLTSKEFKSQYLSHYIERDKEEKPLRIQAILYAIERTVINSDDLRFFNHSMEFLASLGLPIDMEEYAHNDAT